MRQFDNGYTFTRELDSYDELIEIAEDVNGRGDSERNMFGSMSTKDNEWAGGTRSLGEAIELAKFGWPEGAQKLVDLQDKLELDDIVTNQSERVNVFFDVEGDEPDVGRFLSGEPENMARYEITDDAAGKVLNLIVNCSQSASVKPQAIVRRGVAVLSAIDALQKGGYSVGVSMAESSVGSQNSLYKTKYLIPVIKPGDYLNLDSLAFCITHPSFLRRMMFALADHEPWELRKPMGFYEGQSYWDGGGYGQPKNVKKLKGLSMKGGVVIKRDEGMLSSDEQIPAFCKKLAGKLLEAATVEPHDI